MSETTTSTRASKAASKAATEDAMIEALQVPILKVLWREVGRLESMITALRDDLAGEIMTRRIVVVDESGFERVVAEANDSFASVTLTSKDDPSVWTSIHANDEGEPTAGLYLSAGNSGLGTFDVEKSEDGDYRASLIIDTSTDPGGQTIALDREGLSFGR